MSEIGFVDIGTRNAANFCVSEPLEPWSGVRAVWAGQEFDAALPGSEESVIVKPGDQVGFAGDESGRVLEAKIAFGLSASATTRPEHLLDRWAQWLLASIAGDVYYPFEATDAMIDPAAELGDAVTLPDGLSMIYAMSGELDGLCVVDASAPPDEAVNTAYPANWLL